MNKPKICKHCGRYMLDHEHISLTHDEADRVLCGFEISLNDCLLAGHWIETSSTPISSKTKIETPKRNPI